MNIKLGPPQLMELKPRITVIGIGGAGCNAINNMITTQLDGVEFIVANTDAQSLAMSNAEHRIQLGANLTEGLGAGARPEVGEAAAREAEEDIRAEIAGSHMVFIAAGMGGGTGTGAASVIAEIARDLGILTVGIVSKPFQFEGARRMRTADAGIEALEKVVDTLIVIPNQNLFRIANERTTFAEAFRLADQVLYSGIACIVDLIVKEGLINLDFADVQAVMKGMGSAMMGTGEATGEDRALTAANEAIANPLLDNVSLSGAQGLLISIVGGSDLTLYEVDTAASHIRKEVASDANIIVGATTEPGMDDRLRVSIVASGMAMSAQPGNGKPTASEQARTSAGLDGQASSVPTGAPRTPQPLVRPPLAGSPIAGMAGAAKEKMSATSPSDGPQYAEPGQQTGPATATVSEGARRRLEVDLATAAEIDAAEADEFARALSEAMDAAATSAPDSDNAGAQSPSWRSSDGVLVEDGFESDSGRANAPPPLPSSGHYSEQDDQAEFEPAAPAQVRRTSQRMPDLSEFPEVAQREYFAKMEAQQRKAVELPRTSRAPTRDEPRDQVQAVNADQRDRETAPPVAEQSPRPSLLRRLTGTSRK